METTVRDVNLNPPRWSRPRCLLVPRFFSHTENVYHCPDSSFTFPLDTSPGPRVLEVGTSVLRPDRSRDEYVCKVGWKDRNPKDRFGGN